MDSLTCEKAKTLFDDKLDGVIGEKDAALLDGHLATCETCRREYDALKKTRESLLAFAVEIPSELSERVMEGIKKQPKHRVLRAPWLRPLIAVSAAALVCLAVIHSPFVDGMFAAKEVADMAEGANKADSNWNSALGDMDEKPKHDADGLFSEASPEEIAPPKVAGTIAGTSLTLHLTDEQNALLVHMDSGKSETVTYTENEDVITIEKNGKKATLVISGNTLTPTDESLLDALLSE